MNLKRLAILLLIFTLSLSGCSFLTGEKANDKENNQGNSGGKLELKWFTVVDEATSVLPDAQNDFVKKKIEEKFNVDLKMEYMPIGPDRDNQLNVKVASGDVPDMFMTLGVTSQKLALDGVLADMTPFVSPETVPNYFKWVKEEELKRYAIEKKFVRAPVPFDRNVYRSYYIRKDWLDKLGLQVPESYDDMMNVMRAFTFKDPDGNGKKDTYGISVSGNGEKLSIDLPQYIHNDLIGVFMIDKGKLIDVQSDPRIEKVIDETVGMMKEGTIDPDWFLNEGTAHIDRAAQGKVGIVAGNTRDLILDSNPNSLQNKSKAIDPKADWIPFNPFKDKPGIWSENLPETAFLFPKSVADQEPEKIKRSVQILDWLASEEGFLLTHYGIEGKHYTREGNKITLKPDAIQKDIVEKGNFLDIYDCFTPNAPEVLGLEVIDPRMTDRDRNIVETIKSYPKIPSIGTNVTPPKGLNLADFRAKMNEYQAKLLFDEKSGKNWPKYRQELLTKYKGQAVFQSYVEQIRAVGFKVEDFK
ncbi:extracellular solute-binding protein [Paenactinomyces guangxiensis]|uniref:Extracellular solute-binding protein n=1 Tax=Paenactinomyces guangxiensis TaxID=1490290 RepID=A0A7W1WV33_9BACL|nr:extracellular solute-binding protein [Paenactinomyces guangxiensis]MBA4496482.1 extracellular solute-binding protein [Paenactinomyces guangxiensis]MBH8593592.1 extracellular solute-binding protein [Paenactinomyces guangxiensis]